MSYEQHDRFRSFTERYVIERAGHFEAGREQEQAWVAVQDAKKIYGMIAEAKNETDTPEPSSPSAGQVQQATPIAPTRTPLRTQAARNAPKAVPPAMSVLQRMAGRLKGY